MSKHNTRVTDRPGGKPTRGNFHLDKRNGKIFGVSSGIANYAGIDPMIVRLGFVIGAILSVGTAGFIYLAIALIAD